MKKAISWGIFAKIASETNSTPPKRVTLLPGMLSPADLRHLKTLTKAFELEPVMVPDGSESLDNGFWEEYKTLPTGGTPLEEIRRLNESVSSIEMGGPGYRGESDSPAEWLEAKHDTPAHTMPLPIGLKGTDRLMNALCKSAQCKLPEEIEKSRSRLIDTYVDAHKYVFGQRVVVYGDEDMCAGLAGFLEEIGCEVAAVASGAPEGQLRAGLRATMDKPDDVKIFEDTDFETLRENLDIIKPDLMIGNSKGYVITRERKIPLVRVGLPVHDRFGAARILHVGYEGAAHLLDEVVNSIINFRQETSSVGYKYM